jgi:hypothetical protein
MPGVFKSFSVIVELFRDISIFHPSSYRYFTPVIMMVVRILSCVRLVRYSTSNHRLAIGGLMFDVFKLTIYEK